ncbi:MAG: MFS transporter [Dehalococcoidia bacterium]|nr:MFS transporter [Dehalococcoidia bacterium]
MTDIAQKPETAIAPEPAQAPGPGKGIWLETFSSLKHRDYRLLFLGTMFMSAGQWVQQVTLGWLVYDLTNSSVLLGALNGLRALPFLVVGPLAGVVADRTDRRLVLLWVEAVQFIAAFIMGGIVLAGAVEVWHLFVFTAVTGAGWSIIQPVRQALAPAVVPRSDLPNAVALNSVGFNIMKILGPSVGGFLIAVFGAGGNFWVQGLAYAGVFGMVALMRVPSHGAGAVRQGSAFENLKEGAAFVLKTPIIRAIMLVALVPTFLGQPAQALMPVFQKDVLKVGPDGLGLMLAAPGIGAVVCTLALASVANRIERKGQFALLALAVYGVSIMWFALTTTLEVALLSLIVMGGAQIMFHATVMTILQMVTPDALRSRVMSIYMLDAGLSPLGALAAGVSTEFVGAPATFLVLGTLLVGFCGVIWVAFPAFRTWTAAPSPQESERRLAG